MKNTTWIPLLLALVSACASTPDVKKQAYADLREKWTFESELPTVWKGIEKAFENYRVSERDPSEVSQLEMKHLRERTLETDWVIGQSRDKYIEFKVNDLPKKQYLQTRVRFKVRASRVLGGTEVAVHTDEELERLNADGSVKGWEEADTRDTSRTNEMIEKIKLAILSAD
jgi:hypothetical protein